LVDAAESSATQQQQHPAAPSTDAVLLATKEDKNPSPAVAAAAAGARNVPPDATSFNQITLSESLVQTIPAYGYWNVQFYQPEAGYVNFALKVPRGASLGLYGRKNALPTHTNYDVMEVVKGLEDQRVSRRAIRVSA
jgi:hypothetical protein